ncbi:hypothetical protein [Streptomyces sp. NPDC059881]|uniref:hypothetical protein n=1 Tax=Streptomyces sp. NPDC059881 TaxID=3346986 RepID=UPI00365FDA5F
MATPPYPPPPPYVPQPPANQLGGKHKTVLGCGGLLFTFVLIGAIGSACSPTGSETTKKVPAPAVTVTVTATATVTPAANAAAGSPKRAQESAPAPAASAEPVTTKARLSDHVGQQLQAAQDAAQAEGFLVLTSHDATGANRMQVWDRNWKVCSQSPGPGTLDTATTIDFGAVKLEEACP